jgi:hypothetical protein
VRLMIDYALTLGLPQAATNRAPRCSQEVFGTARRCYVRSLAFELVSVATPDSFGKFIGRSKFGGHPPSSSYGETSRPPLQLPIRP